MIGLRRCSARRCSTSACGGSRPATDPVEIFVRTSCVGTAHPGGFVLLPIAGEVAADRPVEAAGDPRSGAWRYLRFWLVKTLIRTNPLVLFAGSPLYLLYLRALGAKIGRA